jgi:hypothetical protein
MLSLVGKLFIANNAMELAGAVLTAVANRRWGGSNPQSLFAAGHAAAQAQSEFEQTRFYQKLFLDSDSGQKSKLFFRTLWKILKVVFARSS